jgi:TetR/AcrR family transcriptional repressor of nem operon
MARPREFDEDLALDHALQLFWLKGYASASLDDLCEVTGLGRSSLYAAFGSKQALYMKTLARYEEGSARRISAALEAPVPVAEALETFLNQMIDDIVAGPGRRGCFIGNCAAEMASRNRGTATRIKTSLARIEGAFREGLVRARARGELPDSADVGALARFLTAGIQGLRLVGKANPDKAALRDIAAVMLRCVHA